MFVQPTKIREAIKLPRDGKTTSPDGILAEDIMANANTSIEVLYKLLSRLWEMEEIHPQTGEKYI